MAYQLSIHVPAGSAGVEGTLTDRTPSATPGTRGTTLLPGAYQRGPTDRAILHTSKGDYLRRRGAAYQGDDTPLAAEDFLALSYGKAPLISYRVVDGDEAKSEIPLYDRHVDLSDAVEVGAQRLPSRVGTPRSGYAGDDYGPGKAKIFYVADMSAAVSGSVFTPANGAETINEWIGAVAQVVVAGQAEALTVSSNTATTFTVEEGFGAFGTIGAVPGTVLVYHREYGVDNSEDQGIAVKVTDGGQRRDSDFGIEVFDKGILIGLPDAKDLDLNNGSSKDRYYKDVLQSLFNDGAQFEINLADADDNFSGDYRDQRLRPANLAEVIESVSGNVITVKTMRWSAVKTANVGGGTGDGWVIDGGSSGVVPHTVILTSTGGGGYEVEIKDPTETYDLADGLPSGTTGVSYTAAQGAFGVWTLVDGATPFASGDQVKIHFRPLAIVDGSTGLLPLRGGRFNCHAFSTSYSGGGDTSLSFPIIANTDRTITVPLGSDLSSITVPAAPAALLGTLDETFDFSATGDTFIYQLDTGLGYGSAITLISSLVGAAETASAVAADLNTQDAANNLTFTAIGTKVQVAINTTTHPGKGGLVKIKITTGTCNAILGYTNDTEIAGTDGTVARVEWAQSLTYGNAGYANLEDADYTGTLLDPADSNTLIKDAVAGVNAGLITMALPGTEDVQVQKAVETYAKAKGYFAFVHIASSVTTVDAARAWVASNLVGNRLAWPVFPSYGYRNEHPYGGSGDYLGTLLGGVLGIMARYAAEYGEHKAVAGVGASLNSIVRRLTTDTHNGGPPVADGPLNLAGILPVIHQGSSIYLYGDEAPGENHKSRIWGHKMRAVLQIWHDLLYNLNQYTYDEVTSEFLATVRGTLWKRMVDYYRGKGLTGTTVRNSFSIQCDEGNNDIEAGDGTVKAEVQFKIVGTAKVISLDVGTGNLVATV